MTYFVFIESNILTTPHMEPLASSSDDDALVEARQLMALHSSAIAAHVFLGEDRVGSILPEATAAA